MKEKVLITGGTGSGGSFLAEYILENHSEWEVWCTNRWHSTGNLKNIEAIKNRIIVKECDLTDLSCVIRLLQECMPSKIFHLAATANVRICFDNPLSVYLNNVVSTMNLFEGIRMVCPESKTMLCSTSETLGNPQEFPMTESHRCQPVNPYAASKMSSESLAYAWAQSWGLKIVITRAFAYLNFRRKELFSTAFALQVCRIEANKQKVLKHGNLNSTRTLIDVRDVVRAYWIALDKCEYSTPYNIGGSDILTVGDFLEILKSKSKVKIICEQDKSLMRPKDVDKQICDVSKFNTLTGFKPKYTLEESIDYLLEKCREEVKNES